MRSRRTSGNALIKMTSELTETLRDMHARWYDAINNLEHIEEEQTWYQFPPLSPERRKVVEQTFQERIDRAGTQMMNAQQIAAKNADDLRGILLSEIPKESRTQEDDKQAELFKHLDTASGYPNCCPDLESRQRIIWTALRNVLRQHWVTRDVIYRHTGVFCKLLRLQWGRSGRLEILLPTFCFVALIPSGTKPFQGCLYRTENAGR